MTGSIIHTTPFVHAKCLPDDGFHADRVQDNLNLDD